jgi:hypothetical protein
MEQKLFLGRIQNNFPYFVFRQPGNGSQYGRGELTTSTHTHTHPTTLLISLIFGNMKNLINYLVEVTHANVYFAIGSMVTHTAENLVPH